MDALRTRLEVLQERAEVAAIFTEFVLFCKEVDEAEGTNIYDADSFTLMAQDLFGISNAALQVAVTSIKR